MRSYVRYETRYNVNAKIIHNRLGRGRTCFNHINTDVLDTRLDLLLHKTRRNDVNPLDARGVLSSECRGGRHRIALVCRENLLIGFEAPAALTQQEQVSSVATRGHAG
jgi:hypothetical protein